MSLYTEINTPIDIGNQSQHQSLCVQKSVHRSIGSIHTLMSEINLWYWPLRSKPSLISETSPWIQYLRLIYIDLDVNLWILGIDLYINHRDRPCWVARLTTIIQLGSRTSLAKQEPLKTKGWSNTGGWPKVGTRKVCHCHEIMQRQTSKLKRSGGQ